MHPATPLPAFDQRQLDTRFLHELARLRDADVFPTYRAWAETVGVQPARLAGIQAGRYHCNLDLLYTTLRHYPQFDYQYVLLGSAVYARPEPAAPPRRRRGPAPGAEYQARKAAKRQQGRPHPKPTP